MKYAGGDVGKKGEECRTHRGQLVLRHHPELRDSSIALVPFVRGIEGKEESEAQKRVAKRMQKRERADTKKVWGGEQSKGMGEEIIDMNATIKVTDIDNPFRNCFIQHDVIHHNASEVTGQDK